MAYRERSSGNGGHSPFRRKYGKVRVVQFGDSVEGSAEGLNVDSTANIGVKIVSEGAGSR